MGFGAKVAQRLAAMGWRQGDLAAALGTSQQQVSRWVAGDKPPKPAKLRELARVLAVPVDYLLDDDADPPPPRARRRQHTEDHEAIVELFDALGLSRAEGLRRLAGQEALPEKDDSPDESAPGRHAKG